MDLATLWSWQAALVALAALALLRRRRKDDESNIPWATGAIPLLGHALAYKRDPATFITEQRKLVGDVFRLNLAGKRMIVVAGGAENVKAVAFASERRFSARAAVRDVGWVRWAWSRKAFLCVFGLNQLGSALYAYLLGSLELSLAVPLCNSLTFVVTAVAGYALGEHVQHPRMLVAGARFVVFGTAICMVSSAQGNANLK